MSLFQNEFDSARISLDEKLNFDIATLLQKANVKVSIAESITAGHILSRFSSLPNQSHVLYGGVVCCHPLSFMTFCGLSPALFAEHSLNHKYLAELMANKLYEQTKTMVCISTTGFIEKKQNESKSAKLYLGFLINKQFKIKALEVTGSQSTIYKNAAQATLAFLKHLLPSMLNIEQEKLNKEYHHG